MTRSRDTLLLVAAMVAVLAALPAAGGAAGREQDAASPARAVALIRTFSCAGEVVNRGSGFLVGESVVMTSRNVLAGACKVKVTVGGTTVSARRWSSWNGPGVTEVAADLQTLVLEKAITNGRVLSIALASPKIGAKVSTLGFPRGNSVARAAGTVVWKGKRAGAPLLAVRLRPAGAADGAPVLDGSGNVLGVVQKARGARDLNGVSTKGVAEALDLAAWWGKTARTVLCDTYPNGGVPGCGGEDTTPAPAPPAKNDPVTEPETGVVPNDPGDDTATDPAAPPRAPTDYVVKGCWVQFTNDSWTEVDPGKALTSVASTELLAKGPGKYWAVVQLTLGAPADIPGVTASLVSPSDFVSAGTPFTWDVDAEAAARPLDWQITSNGNWFFQSALYPKPQLWTIRWKFPNGQACDARFTVT